MASSRVAAHLSRRLLIAAAAFIAFSLRRRAIRYNQSGTCEVVRRRSSKRSCQTAHSAPSTEGIAASIRYSMVAGRPPCRDEVVADVKASGKYRQKGSEAERLVSDAAR
jgi:hypothetical protein